AGAKSGPLGIAVTPQNDFAFVANANANDGNIYEFSIPQSGTTPGELMSVGSIHSGTTPQIVAIDSTGTFVYVTNAGSRTVSEYAINSQTQNVLKSIGTIGGFSGTPFGIVAHPSASFVYVADSTIGVIAAYSIGGSGALTFLGSVGSLGTGQGHPGLMTIAVDSSQSYLLVDDTVQGVVSVFLIQSNGTLTFSNFFGTGQSKPMGIASVNSGGGTSNNYVLTANNTGNFVQPYIRVGATLTQQPNAVAVPSNPTGLVIDPAGLFAYTANSGNGSISLIGINSSECNGKAFCNIQNFASETPANGSAGTQYVATTH
ncbi:MAG TPA: beta-propeller fold lactonase family protein, partial [Candidatus Binataceae bacterium]|nr:beta-propeller fold lactonase family protein [Candidatus Binataceae bacterium]